MSSFLHSKRLHWGAHHEVMENLHLQIDRLLNRKANHAETTPAALGPTDQEGATPEERLARQQLLDDLLGP